MSLPNQASAVSVAPARKRVLVVTYSQTGQLRDIIDHCLAPFTADAATEVDIVQVNTRHRFPFPWTNVDFFGIFPESVNGTPFELEPLDVDPDRHYDLIILGYTVWFLQPSIPISRVVGSSPTWASSSVMLRTLGPRGDPPHRA